MESKYKYKYKYKYGLYDFCWEVLLCICDDQDPLCKVSYYNTC